MKLAYVFLILTLLISACRHNPLPPELNGKPAESISFLRDTMPHDFSQFYTGTNRPSWLNTEYPEKAITKFTRNKVYPNRWLIEETSYRKTDQGWRETPILWIADFGTNTKTKVNLSLLDLANSPYSIQDWNGPYFLIYKSVGRHLLLYNHDLQTTDTIAFLFSGTAKLSPNTKLVAYKQHANTSRQDICLHDRNKNITDTSFTTSGSVYLLGWNADSESVLFALGWGWQCIYQVGVKSSDTLNLHKGYDHFSFMSAAHGSHNWILGGESISILDLKIGERREMLQEFSHLKTHSITPVGSSSDYLALRSHYTQTQPYHFTSNTGFFLIDKNGQNVRSVTFNFDLLQEI